MSQKVFQSLSDIEPVITAHGKGKRFIFLAQQDPQTALTQFAYGTLISGEDVPQYLHPTMEEYFYFIDGEGECLIDDVVYKISPGSFFRISANTAHALKATGERPLTFVYFGIAA